MTTIRIIAVIPYYQHSFTFRGESLTTQSGTVSATAWQDRKVVMAMFTNCDPQMITSVLRQQSDGNRQEVPSPHAITSYNKFMGGVDRGDQLRGYYRCRVKSRKFYKYIFYFIIDVAITNAYILHQGWSGSNKLNIKNFRAQLAKEIIGEYCTRRRAGHGSSFVKPLPICHFPTKIPETFPGQRKRGRCTYCSQRDKRTDSQWFCQECSIWLCHTGTESDCFMLWHKNKI